jgi:hypothetical protein
MDLVSDLEKGQSCRRNDRFIEEDEQFNCSSIQLGNAILALKVNLGPDWQSEQNWANNLTDLYNALRRVGERLQGPSLLRDNRDYHSRRDPGNHSSCSQSGRFCEQLEPIYKAATAGLPFQEFGNMAYRTLRANTNATE